MTSGDPPKAGRREWLGLAVLALPTFLVSIDIFVLLLALPELSQALGASSTEQLWISDIYGFMLAGFLITMGTLGDRIGRRKVLLTGAFAFAAFSILAAESSSPGMLIASRALMGIAGATLMPSTLALITTMFKDPRERATAFGAWGGVFTLGAIVGPMIGGLLLGHFWWGSVFLLAAPVMLVLLITGPIVLPEYRNNKAGRLDPPSVVLSLLTMLPIIWGIKQLARSGWQPLPVIAIIIGIVAGVVFCRRQRTLADPVLDLRIFRVRPVSTMLASQLSYSVTTGGFLLFMLQYFELVRGLSPIRAAIAMVPGMLGATTGFIVAPILARRIRPAVLISIGMIMVVAVMVVFAQIGATSGTLTLVIGFAVWAFFGTPLVALGTNLIVGSVPPERAGSAGSMAQMSNEFGGTLGAALMGTIGFAVYRHDVAGSIPAGLSAHDAATARDSLAGASEASSHVSHQLGTSLLTPAHQAFVNGVHTVAVITAIVVFGIAILIAFRLKYVPPIGTAEAAASTPPAEEIEAATVSAPQSESTPQSEA